METNLAIILVFYLLSLVVILIEFWIIKNQKIVITYNESELEYYRDRFSAVECNDGKYRSKEELGVL